MNRRVTHLRASTFLFWVFCIHSILLPSQVAAQEREIPEVLKPWTKWVTWDDKHLNCPTVYHNAEEHICFWPAQLSLQVDEQGGTWSLQVTAFEETWVPLPGSSKTWPLDVRSGEAALVVVERNEIPAVQLEQGQHKLSGKFLWDQMPQRIAIPKQIGILDLAVKGEAVPIPNWDANGQVWLQRIRREETEKDLLVAQVYRLIEDGIPTWLLTEIELTVSGKSREEDLGWLLPADFRLSSVDSPIPVAVDDMGRMKAQVRAGKWTIQTRAFRLADIAEIQFAEAAEPIVDRELVAFRSRPTFRLAELEGLPKVDVTQTTFPDKWRKLPVYQWDTSSAFQLSQKMRGMGEQRPEGLTINRRFWLDEDGTSLTYQDNVSGRMQQIWRLDVAEGQELGAVRIDGEGQLITSNPESGAHGVEIRKRNLNLEAIGRINQTRALPATGWQTDADSLTSTIVLPPGWRAMAVFGPDSVRGDWLTAWSLLDLFLLLVFSMGVFRVCGMKAGIIAFLAFGLAYHEIGSPRLTWLFLLIPVALTKVVPEGTAKKLVGFWRITAIGVLVLSLVPFVVREIQTTIYPQLERPGTKYEPRSFLWRMGAPRYAAIELARQSMDMEARDAAEAMGKAVRQARIQTANLLYDPQARIQTGPAQPQWNWITVHCSWDGPVTADQTIRPILISMNMHRVLAIVRVALLLVLAAILIGAKKTWMPSLRRPPAAAVVAAVLLVLGFLSPERLHAQSTEIPSKEMLDQLRERLLQPPDVYPRAAEVVSVDLRIDDDRVQMLAEIHAAIDVAVPVPGKLPVWSPVSVSIDEKPADLVARQDDYLWIVMPQGVHQVAVESLLPDVSEWEWTYLLKPRRVTVDARGWNVTGIRPNGVPEQQVFFSRQQALAEGEAAYDRRDFNAVVAIDRHLEVGLVWQVRTTVTRLSAEGKAVSLNVPLLPGESVLTSNVTVEGGEVEVRLAAGQETFSWTSDLPLGEPFQLATRDADEWVERWHLVTSPVWNVSRDGLAPVFEAQQENMVPVWHPWPGENVSLAFHKPTPVSGDIMTVQRVEHSLEPARRQRTSRLKLDVECSLGSDFVLEIPARAEVSSLQLDDQAIPVRRDGDGLIIPVHPGRQTIEVLWKTNETMATVVRTGEVKLPVEGSNVTKVMQVQDSRWVLWTDGPLRGPAVRFWTILVSALLIAFVLGSVSTSPLSRLEWMLLAIGLTQVPVVAAAIVVVWLFLLAYRGKQNPQVRRAWIFNLGQISMVLISFVSLCILIVIVGEGLLGHPDMFIIGNQSTRTHLKWFQPRTGQELPVASIVSVSVWYYRLLMLFWALWLAAALIRWLKWGWEQFSHGGIWRRMRKEKVISTTD